MVRILAALAAFASLLAAQDGAKLHADLCASCHDAQTRQAPELRTMSAERILAALESGPMVPVAARRTALERRAIAEFASGKPFTEEFSLKPIPQATCGVDPGTVVDATKGPVWNGWGFSVANTRFQPTPGVTAAQVPRLKLAWAFAFPGEISSDAHATVAGGRLFIGSQSGLVYSLDAASGCIYWIFQAQSRVRAAVSIGRVQTANGPRDAAFVADGFGYVYSLEAATGRLLWRTAADPAPGASIVGSPAFFGDALFVPITREGKGALVALNAATGKRIWTAPSAAIVTAPAIDAKRKAVYAGTTSSVLALDMETGQLLWSRDILDSASPVLANLPNGRSVLVVGQKAGAVLALDPDNKGATLWQAKMEKGGVQRGSAADSQNVYVPLAETPAEANTNAAGGIVALRLADGKRVWSAPPGKCGTRPRCSPAQSQAASAMPGVVFSGSVDGHIRGYSALNGRVQWDFDTWQSYETVNAVPGRGGSLDGPGPVIAGGRVYVHSGYALAGGQPGNVLLVFSVDGK